ncbi:hypothetical protein MRB53_010112 [Persea americana]|uniref:Uncharacterized protein n=1 Tax=Persea americana TaxID=3435 RepID=A0ACC2LR48_PERAE|nr:hypothetical protein MRB53_010112 [Persea americana]
MESAFLHSGQSQLPAASGHLLAQVLPGHRPAAAAIPPPTPLQRPPVCTVRPVTLLLNPPAQPAAHNLLHSQWPFTPCNSSPPTASSSSSPSSCHALISNQFRHRPRLLPAQTARPLHLQLATMAATLSPAATAAVQAAAPSLCP